MGSLALQAAALLLLLLRTLLTAQLCPELPPLPFFFSAPFYRAPRDNNK